MRQDMGTRKLLVLVVCVHFVESRGNILFFCKLSALNYHFFFFSWYVLIDMQLKKVQRKMNCVEDLEVIMEKENALLEELEESLVAERIDVLQKLFSAGISRSKD